jgi:hypothetical protein
VVWLESFDNQLSMVGCPVWSILLNMSIPNAESDELANDSTTETQHSNHELERNFLTEIIIRKAPY